jgi:hypothetical protein
VAVSDYDKFASWVARGVRDQAFAQDFDDVDFVVISRLLGVTPHRSFVVDLLRPTLTGVVAPVHRGRSGPARSTDRTLRPDPMERIEGRISPGLLKAAQETPWGSPASTTSTEIVWQNPDDGRVVRVFREGARWRAEADGVRIPPKKKRLQGGVKGTEDKVSPLDAIELALEAMTARRTLVPVEVVPPAPDETLRLLIAEATPGNWTYRVEESYPESGLIIWTHIDDRVILRDLGVEAKKGSLESVEGESSWRLDTPEGQSPERWDDILSALDAARSFMEGYRPTALPPTRVAFSGPEWAVAIVDRVQDLGVSRWLTDLGFEGYVLQPPSMQGRLLQVEWLKADPADPNKARAGFVLEASEISPAGKVKVKRAFKSARAHMVAPQMVVTSADDIEMDKLIPEEWVIDIVLPRVPATHERLSDGRELVEKNETGDETLAWIFSVVARAIESLLEDTVEALCAPGGVDRAVSALCTDEGKVALSNALAVTSGGGTYFGELAAKRFGRASFTDALHARLCSPGGRQIVQRVITSACSNPRPKIRGLLSGPEDQPRTVTDYASARTVRF